MTLQDISKEGGGHTTDIRPGSRPENPEGWDSVDIQTDILQVLEQEGEMQSHGLKEKMLEYGYAKKDTRTHLGLLRKDGEVERVEKSEGIFYRVVDQ